MTRVSELILADPWGGVCSLPSSGSAAELAAAKPVKVDFRKLRRVSSLWLQQSQIGKEDWCIRDNSIRLQKRNSQTNGPVKKQKL